MLVLILPSVFSSLNSVYISPSHTVPSYIFVCHTRFRLIYLFVTHGAVIYICPSHKVPSYISVRHIRCPHIYLSVTHGAVLYICSSHTVQSYIFVRHTRCRHYRTSLRAHKPCVCPEGAAQLPRYQKFPNDDKRKAHKVVSLKL